MVAVVDCIYLAAGQGVRAGLGYPKQLHRLGGRPLLVHALETLARMPEIETIILVCPEGRRDEFDELVRAYVQPVVAVEGGKSRQESVLQALPHVCTERVMIHEAVRPFVTQELVRRVLAVDAPAVTAWRPVTSSAVDALEPGSMPRREYIGEVQMPQAFDTSVLETAHQSVDGMDDYTCDAHLVYCVLGMFPELVLGEQANIKITTPLDLVLAEAIHAHRHHGRE